MWRLLQLSDGGYPTGGFVHSGGLEAIAALGELSDIRALVVDAAWQHGHGALPLVRRAHAEPAALPELDAAADAFLVAEPANRASRAQGRALLEMSTPVTQVWEMSTTSTAASAEETSALNRIVWPS